MENVVMNAFCVEVIRNDVVWAMYGHQFGPMHHFANFILAFTVM